MKKSLVIIMSIFQGAGVQAAQVYLRSDQLRTIPEASSSSVRIARASKEELHKSVLSHRTEATEAANKARLTASADQLALQD